MLDQSNRVSGAASHELIARARALLSELGTAARDTELLRRVPEPTMAKLREAELHRLCQPTLFGGFEYGGEALLDLSLVLSSACAATGWCIAVCSGHHWLLALYDSRAQDDVWGADANALLCGSYAPTGKVEAVDGGYRLSGSWSFASGCDHATWAIVGGMIPADGETPSKPAFFLIPKSDYVIVDDWFTSGLSGSGSKSIQSDGCFVPAHRIIDFAEVMRGNARGAALHSHPLYRVPLVSYIPILLGAVAVGAAQGAVRTYTERVTVRETRGAIAGGRMRMADFTTIQVRLAEAAAAADTAEMLLRNAMHRLEAIAASGRDQTMAERIARRRDQAFAVRLAIQATEILNASTGGAGLYLDDPVQRAWRDANAVGRHVSLNWDAVGSMYGQFALGLPPLGQY